MTDWSTLKKLIWLRIIKGGSAVLKTVTGSLIHITDALALPAESLSVNVEPIQDLHGYDNPWPSGGNVNKMLLASSDKSGTVSGITYSYSRDTEKITLSGTNTNTSAHSLKYFTSATEGMIVPDFQVGETYTLMCNLPTTMYCQFTYKDTNNVTKAMGYKLGTGAISSVTFTVPSDFVTLTDFQVYVTGTATTLSGEIYFELVSGSTAPTAFSPYSNICPISGRTSATVTRTGKNLLPSVLTQSGSSIVVLGQNNDTGFGLSLKAGTYTVSLATENLGAFYYRANNGTSNVHIGAYNVTSATFTLTEDTVLRLYYYKSSGVSVSDISNPQLELGSTASAYEPYAGNTYTIQLGDTVYGGTLDVTGGKMVVDRAIASISKSNFLNKASGSVMDYRNSSIVYPPTASFTNWNVARQQQTCNMARIANANTEGGYGDYVAVVYTMVGNPNAANLRVSEPLYQAMSENDILEICYQLATPIEITLTPTQIDMLLGENNLWADAGDSTLTYYADGNASTSEALGILLGGTYNNPGGADDVSDDEALGILLGGS